MHYNMIKREILKLLQRVTKRSYVYFSKEKKNSKNEKEVAKKLNGAEIFLKYFVILEKRTSAILF